MAQRITIREVVTVDPLWQGTCPCGQEVIFAEDELGTPQVFHGIPQCEDYEGREILDYMRWLRLSLADSQGL